MKTDQREKTRLGKIISYIGNRQSSTLDDFKAIAIVYGERAWPFPCTELYMNRLERDQGSM